MADETKVKDINDVNVQNDTADDDTVEVELLVPITVRFPRPRYDQITLVAERHKKSKAEICRLAVDNRLIKYLGVQNYTTPHQEQLIYELAKKILNEITKVRLELNRIGCNYNQEVRILHLKEKMKATTTQHAFNELAVEYANAENGIGVVKADEMERLVDKYNEVFDKTAVLMRELL